MQKACRCPPAEKFAAVGSFSEKTGFNNRAGT
jgi:hypothetical protein